MGRTLDLYLANILASVTLNDCRTFIVSEEFCLWLWPIPLYTVMLVETPWLATLGETVWYHRLGAATPLATPLAQNGQVSCVFPGG